MGQIVVSNLQPDGSTVWWRLRDDKTHMHCEYSYNGMDFWSHLTCVKGELP